MTLLASPGHTAPTAPDASYPATPQPTPTDARSIPDCPVCRRQSCADPAACRRHLVAHHATDVRQVRGLDDDMSAFVLTPHQARERYGRAA